MASSPSRCIRNIKEKAGVAPFQELAKYGILSLGEAVTTEGGKLEQKIIHVAGLNCFWVATEQSIINSTKNIVLQAQKHNFKSVAMPLIGAGTGGKKQKEWKPSLLTL